MKLKTISFCLLIFGCGFYAGSWWNSPPATSHSVIVQKPLREIKKEQEITNPSPSIQESQSDRISQGNQEQNKKVNQAQQLSQEIQQRTQNQSVLDWLADVPFVLDFVPETLIDYMLLNLLVVEPEVLDTIPNKQDFIKNYGKLP